MSFSDPTIFVQIWVDTNAAQAGSTTGVYLNDNRVSAGSKNEGSATLASSVTANSVIQWSIFNIDRNSADSVQISAIGNSSAWGASGQPQKQADGSFVGQAQTAGSAGYQVTLTIQQAGGSGKTININPSLKVA